jgi:predicted nucleotidyltransferase
MSKGKNLKHGLSLETRAKINTLFAPWRSKRTSFKVYIFGSRALGTHRPYSDIDLLILATPPLQQFEKEQLLEQIEESELPYKFDLVFEEDLLDEYKNSINQSKKKWA